MTTTFYTTANTYTTNFKQIYKLGLSTSTEGLEKAFIYTVEITTPSKIKSKKLNYGVKLSERKSQSDFLNKLIEETLLLTQSGNLHINLDDIAGVQYKITSIHTNINNNDLELPTDSKFSGSIHDSFSYYLGNRNSFEVCKQQSDEIINSILNN